MTDWAGLEEHHLHLLRLAAEALDRGEEARKTITREGATYRDRFGAPRKHPAAAIAAESAATFARLVRALGLDATEPGPPRNQWRRPPKQER